MMTPDLIPGQEGRAAAIAGLRALADFLDCHPDVPADRYAAWVFHMFPDAHGDAGRVAVDEVAAALGVTVTDGTATGGHYVASRSFGPVSYQFTHIPEEYRARAAARQSYEDNILPAAGPAGVAA